MKNEEKWTQKIKKNGFTKKNLLEFKRKYDYIKATYHPDLTSDITLQEIIKNDTREALSIIKTTVLLFCFFVFGSLITSTIGAAFFFIFLIFLVFIFMVISSAKNNNLTAPTYIKLLKLAIRTLI